MVVNAAGSVLSAAATLTVYVPPSISSQPSSATVLQNGTAVFSVGVSSSGTAPFSYQWSVNGTIVTEGPNVSGATSNVLTLNNVQAGQAGNVFVVVTNLGGSVTSTIRTLTVNVPAAITVPPSSLTVTQWQTATFSVEAVGTPTLNYQWYLNGVSLGNNYKTATISGPVNTNSAGSYTVVVNNSYGYATSAPVTLTVLVPAQISSQPTNQAVTLGQSATFSVIGFGDAPLKYQWSFNGADVVGATNPSLVLNNLQTNQAGNYAVRITNNWGSVTSTNATLVVYVPPSIVTQPISQALIQGQTVSFSVQPDGSAPFTYQWYLNGASLGSGARSATYTKSNIGTSEAGNYTVTVTGPGGSVTSAVASLIVYVPPSISSQPSSVTALQGGTATFSVGMSSSGSVPFSYQWSVNGVIVTRWAEYFGIDEQYSDLKQCAARAGRQRVRGGDQQRRERGQFHKNAHSECARDDHHGADESGLDAGTAGRVFRSRHRNAQPGLPMVFQ